MAATETVPKLPSLTTSTTTLETETTRPALLKETSTVGDLISFTDRGPRRDSPVKTLRRRRSVGDSGSFLQRRESLQRHGSLKALPSVQRHSSLSLQDGHFSASPDDDNQLDTSRRRRSRRDSMMNALRDELEKIPCLQAIRRFSSVTSQDNDDDMKVFADSDTEDDLNSTNRRRLSRRTPSVFRSESCRSDSSQESIAAPLTEYELRKLQMIYTLNRMDGKEPVSGRKKSMDSLTGEVAVLEASFLKGRKRGSIATHVLMKARKRRNSNNTAQSKTNITIPDDLPEKTPSEAEQRAEAQKEKSNKIFQLLKKAEKPKLVGISDPEKNEGEKKMDAVKDGLASFRKRLKRKKVLIMYVIF